MSKEERELGEGVDLGEGKLTFTDEADRAKEAADQLLAEGEEDQQVVMKSTTGAHTSVSLPGRKELLVDKKGCVKVALRHVPTLRQHGFEVVKIA